MQLRNNFKITSIPNETEYYFNLLSSSEFEQDGIRYCNLENYKTKKHEPLLRKKSKGFISYIVHINFPGITTQLRITYCRRYNFYISSIIYVSENLIEYVNFNYKGSITSYISRDHKYKLCGLEVTKTTNGNVKASMWYKGLNITNYFNDILTYRLYKDSIKNFEAYYLHHILKS